MNSPDAVVAVADKGTAAQLATAKVPIARSDSTIGDVRSTLVAAGRFDSVTDVAVVDGNRLVGLARIEDVLAAGAAELLGTIMDVDPPVVTSDEIQEATAWKAVEHGQGAIAVVDPDGGFIGLIPPWRMLGVLLDEHDQDIARLAGYLHDSDGARSAMTESVARRLWHRLPWLLVGLIGALAAAAIVGSFEERLVDEVALAFFIPGIVYIADAVGTQTEAVVVRGLSVGVRMESVVARELTTGVVMGAILAGVSYPIVLVWASSGVALTVATTTWAACAMATTIAMGLPWALRLLGADPAFGSGPLATVVQDELSIIIYFGFAMVFI